MAGIPSADIFGTSVLDLATLHSVATLNNAHIVNGKKLVPTVFNASDYDTAENKFALIQAAFFGYAINNPKRDANNNIVSPRMFNMDLIYPLEGTTGWNNSLTLFNQFNVTNYFTGPAVDGYDPSAD